jgi:dipeptidyl aminopeptidase/acylaminoacyl peptidase
MAATLEGDSAHFVHPRVAPGARRIAVEVAAPNRDIWTYDLATRALMPVTTDGFSERPEWTPDGQRIAFVNRAGSQVAIKWKPWDGSGTTEVLVDSSESSPRISPKGRLIAYVSDESGRREVYLRPLPGPGSRVPVSNTGGDEPIWAADGRELFYRAPGHLMSAVITERPLPDVVRRDTLFADPYVRSAERANYDVFPNGTEFVFVRSAGTEKTSMFVVTNWAEDLRKHLNAAKR